MCVNPTALASASFDPVAVGDLVGSGPWICNPSVGVSTISGQASCTQNANGSPGGQAIGAGGRLLLNRYLGAIRCCPNVPNTSLHKFMWADRNNDWVVTDSGTGELDNPSTPEGVQPCLNMSTADCLYWDSFSNTCAPNVGTTNGVVDIGEVVTAFADKDHILAPQNLVNVDLTTTGLDPGEDPFMLFTSCPYM